MKGWILAIYLIWNGNIVLAALDCSRFISNEVQYLQHPEDCSKFYTCLGGRPSVTQCPAGLLFNSKLQVCDWPQLVDCESTPSSSGTTSKPPWSSETSPTPTVQTASTCPTCPPCNTETTPPPTTEEPIITETPTTTNRPPCPPNLNNPCEGLHDNAEIKGGYKKCPNEPIGDRRIHLEIPGDCGGFIQCDNFRRAFCKRCAPEGLVFDGIVDNQACVWAYESNRTDCNCGESTEEPSTTELPSTTEESSTTEAPTTSEESTSTEDPTTTEEPSTTERPSTTEESSTTEAPTTSEESTTTEDPTTTEEPNTTDPPTTTEEPKTTEEPATTKVPTTTEKSTTTEEPTTTKRPPCPPNQNNPCEGLHDNAEIKGGYKKCPNEPIGDRRIHLEIPGDCGGFIQCDNFRRAFCKRCAPEGLVFDGIVDNQACVWAYESNRTDCNCGESTEEPSTTELPSTTEESSTIETPTTSEEPSTTEASTTTKEPTTTEDLTTTDEPISTEEPATTEVPTTTEEPTTTNPPTTTEEPSTTEEPATTEVPTTTEEPTSTEEPTTTNRPPCPPNLDNPCEGLHDNAEIKGGYKKCPNEPIGDRRIHLEIPGDCGGFIQCDNFRRAFCKRCAPEGLVFDSVVDNQACVWAYESNRTDCNCGENTTAEEPTTTEAPTTTNEPSTTEEPATTEAPTTTEKSTTTEPLTTTEEPATTEVPTTTKKPPCPPSPDNPCEGLHDNEEIKGGYKKCPNEPIGDRRIHLEIPGDCGGFIQCDNFRRAFCKRCAPEGLVFDSVVDNQACVWSYESNRTDCKSTSLVLDNLNVN